MLFIQQFFSLHPQVTKHGADLKCPSLELGEDKQALAVRGLIP
jgi:hypothetical protein